MKSAVGRHLSVVLLVLPPAALYLVFVVYPFVQTVWLSLFRQKGLGAPQTFIGVGNYERLVADPVFWRDLAHNVVWFGITFTAAVIPAFLLAAMISTKGLRGRTLFRTALFLPAALPGVVVGIAFFWIYQPEWGIINVLLRAIGLDGLTRAWLADDFWALPALAMASSWSQFGLFMVIFLAGMQKISPDLYDAALADGAGPGQQLLHVTLPSMRPEITFVSILALVTAFKSFDIIVATTQGGPYGQTEVLGFWVYKLAFRLFEFGYGAAASVALALIIFCGSAALLIVRSRGD